MADILDKPRILVVDDSTSQRDSLIMNLEDDCECIGAANKKEAISIFKDALEKSKPFDAVITDMEMGPGGSGLDVANEIKGENGLSKSTLVFLLSTIIKSNSPYWKLFDKTFTKEDAISNGLGPVIKEVLSVIKDTKAIIAENLKLAKPTIQTDQDKKPVLNKIIIKK